MDETMQSNTVFVDVESSSNAENYPISVTKTHNTKSNTTAIENNDKLVEFKKERSVSPIHPFLEIHPRRIRCKECNKYTAETEEKMLRHVRKIHRGENPFQCYMCDYSTYNKSLFEEHVRIHQGIKPFKCSHCPYRSVSKKNTKKHELIHRPDNPHKCKHCGFIARHLRSLQCHINAQHQDGWDRNGQVQSKSKEKTTLCRLCKRSVGNFESHVKKQIKCPECPTVLCSRNLFKKHMVSKHEEKNKLTKNDFVCAICNWTSVVRPKILLHLIHHPNQKIDDSIDVTVLKECGIVGDGW